jgi:hypothetical protein
LISIAEQANSMTKGRKAASPSAAEPSNPSAVWSAMAENPRHMRGVLADGQKSAGIDCACHEGEGHAEQGVGCPGPLMGRNGFHRTNGEIAGLRLGRLSAHKHQPSAFFGEVDPVRRKMRQLEMSIGREIQCAERLPEHRSRVACFSGYCATLVDAEARRSMGGMRNVFAISASPIFSARELPPTNASMVPASTR